MRKCGWARGGPLSPNRLWARSGAEIVSRYCQPPPSNGVKFSRCHVGNKPFSPRTMNMIPLCAESNAHRQASSELVGIGKGMSILA